MKICLISNLYPPYARGGAEQVVKNTVEGLARLGHEVVIITARPLRLSLQQKEESSEYCEHLDPRFRGDDNSRHGVFKIYRFYPLNIFFYGNDFKYPAWLRFFWHLFDVFNFHSFWRVRQILSKEKPDVVHTHNLKGLGYLIPRAIRGLGLFHAHTLHDVQLAAPSGIIIKGQENNWQHIGLLTRLYMRLCRWLFGSPQVIISPSKFLLDFYEKRGFFPRSRKVVLPNPVIRHCEASHHDIASPEIIGAKQSREFPDKRDCFTPDFIGGSQNRDKDDFHFLYLGQIEEHKGVLLLIRAFKKFYEAVKLCHPERSEGSIDSSACGLRMTTRVTLHLVGAGSKLAEAKRLAADCPQIIFHGKIERENLPVIFAQTDLTIVPSLCYENSPTVIFESFSFGAPVLASSIEGVAELIRSNENGLTFIAGNEADLAAKLRWCAAYPEKIRQMRPAAFKSVEGLDLSAYLDKLLNFCYNK